MGRSNENLKAHCLGAPLEKDSWHTICTECQERIPGGTMICPECGHDFRSDPPPDTDAKRLQLHDELAYTPLAELALSTGRVLSMVGCFAAIGCAALALFCGQWWALIWGPLGFLQSLAMYVVFVRIQDIGKGEMG